MEGVYTFQRLSGIARDKSKGEVCAKIRRLHAIYEKMTNIVYVEFMWNLVENNTLHQRKRLNRQKIVVLTMRIQNVMIVESQLGGAGVDEKGANAVMKNTGKIMTVKGLIPPEALGTTISHEHLIFDLSCYLRPAENPAEAALFENPVTMDILHFVNNNPYANRDNCVVKDIALPLKELKLFTKYGGNSIIDVTLDDFGRNVNALKEISEKAGVHIVAGCGNYIQSAHPEELHRKSVGQLAKEYIREITEGVGDTGICPGIIGEIGTGFAIHPDEIKVLKAAAIAQKETGLAITVHLHPPVRHGHEVLDILEKEGVSLDRVILGHLCGVLAHRDLTPQQSAEHIASLAGRGCYVEFDLCGNSGYFVTEEASWWLPSDRERGSAIARLCDLGFSNQILLSHDVGHRHYLASYGGWGYSHVLNGFQRTLREAGVSQENISKFTRDNPMKAVTIV